jgi:uncharacterized protein (UPF0335 family)
MSDAAQDKLKSYVERIERLEVEKTGIMADIKEVYGEAKSDGFDTKALRKIISLRKKDETERKIEDAMVETYMAALGMVAE